MLVPILVGVAVVLSLFLAFVATRRADYDVERKIEIASTPNAVFAVLNDLRRFAGAMVLFGEPMQQRDPQMEKTFDGPAAGVGQSYAWSGKEAGKGSLRIDESVVDERVRMTLQFVAPMKSTALYTIALAPASTGTAVSWSMKGKHNFIGRAMGVFLNIDDMLAADVEKSLAQLKTIAETARA